jgi:type I restriction enzyme, S subunit
VSNVLPQGWEEKKLGEIAFLQRGYDLTNSKVVKGSFPVVKSNGIDVFHDEFKVKAPGVTTGRSGTLGNVFFIMENFWPHNTSLFVKNFYENDKKFIYYFLKTANLENYNSGSSVPTLNRNHVHNLTFCIPSDINEQKRIADILSAFDDKIELNNQMNQTLEDMATTLFKEWFENFNFPNEQGKPYKDNDGEMKSSVLGEIPVDWEVKYLKEISETISKGTTPKKNEVDGLDSNVYFLKVKDINNDGTIEFSSLEKIPMEVHQKQLKRSILKTDDILVSIAGTIGRTSIVPSSLDDSNCNQAIAFIRLKNKNVFKKFIYQWIRTLEAQNRIQSGIVQGVQANVSLTTLGDLKIILPSDLIMNKFNSLINPIFEQIQQNQQQNQTLKKQRDTLLPKLMSGEIRV